MPPLSRETLEILQCALDANAEGPGDPLSLSSAMARVRADVSRDALRATDVMLLLRQVIANVPAVLQARDDAGRDEIMQRLAEACLVAYYNAPGKS